MRHNNPSRVWLIRPVAVLLLLLATLTVSAQVTVTARLDSMVLYIGEQAHLTLEVSVPKKARVQWPEKRDTLTAGVEILSESPVDTEWVNDGSRQVLRRMMTITSFDSALYYLPPMEVLVDGQLHRSKNLALKVLTLDVDTIHTDRFAGPKDIMHVPYLWDDWKQLFGASLLLLFAAVLFAYLVLRYYDNKPIIKHLKRIIVLPPHQKAMNKIETIKAEKVWAQEDSKEYYTQLTETLRTYIQERYGFNAMEMTSSEIIEHLMAVTDEQGIRELRQLFETADLVKFAKFNTLINENDMNLVNAIEFIQQTKQEVDPNAKPEPQPLTQEEKRSRSAKRHLLVVLVVLGIVMTAAMVYIIWRTYNLIG